MTLKAKINVALLLGLVSISPALADEVVGLTESLVQKRATIERLTDEVERQKRLRREQERAFGGQKAQLEAELRREVRVRRYDEAAGEFRDEAQGSQRRRTKAFTK